jgi:hypothetical protein
VAKIIFPVGPLDEEPLVIFIDPPLPESDSPPDNIKDPAFVYEDPPFTITDPPTPKLLACPPVIEMSPAEELSEFPERIETSPPLLFDPSPAFRFKLPPTGPLPADNSENPPEPVKDE